jgi:hypothetical protein
MASTCLRTFDIMIGRNDSYILLIWILMKPVIGQNTHFCNIFWLKSGQDMSHWRPLPQNMTGTRPLAVYAPVYNILHILFSSNLIKVISYSIQHLFYHNYSPLFSTHTFYLYIWNPPKASHCFFGSHIHNKFNLISQVLYFTACFFI